LGSSENLDEIVVNGIKRGDLILPTTVTSTSAYGLDLGVMDTPRNNSLISKAQLDALNIQNPGGFSYLTSSSYADAAFGQPNVPRIRGQYGDIYYNGMRDPFTLNGYGAPISFNDVESIDIVKGTASVQQGPGAGVGGSIGITTKMPSFSGFAESFQLEFDSQQKRRASFDVGGPLSSSTAARVSFASDDSGSYYYDMYFHQQSLYAAVITNFTDQYSVTFTGEAVDTRYRENDGVNRVNQALIDNGTYLTGAPPASTISGFGTEVTLGPGVALNDRILIDEPPGTGAHALHAKGQVIQTFKASDDFTITNNTFYDYLNRYNQTEDYYADTAMGSYALENKTDFKVKFALGGISNQIDAGFTFRFEHIKDIQNYSNEPVSVFDLSANPNSWIFPASQQAGSDALLYLAAFNHPQYGVPGRDSVLNLDQSVVDNLQDGAIFLEHRIQFSPEWSLLYGLREDIVQLNEADPLTPLPGDNANDYPDKISTGWYGLHNGNISVVYSPSTHVSAYLTYDNAQYIDPNDNDGSIATWGVNPTTQLRQNSDLEEAGLKFDLLDKRLFISTAIFKQTRAVPSGVGGSIPDTAHIKGAEIELNYQPDPHFFATASYSYLHTLLDSASGFYNLPAQQGINYDGAGSLLQWNGNQRFIDPGIPQHLFNVLANYKHESGFGAQANIQVTGPIQTTQTGYVNIAATNNNASFLTPTLVGPGGLISSSVIAANGLYTPPTIPWQYTLNAGVFYNFAEHYTVKFMVYNLTDQHNLINDYPFYGNDFLTRVPPRSYDLTLSGKF
jgi:outer membrane receptor protein involved in Fe transport